MFFILSLFWFIRTCKIVLFWIYLWQLKEYHIGRLFDHFSTRKGKTLIFHPLQIFKIVLTGLFVLSILTSGITLNFLLILFLFLIYFTESLFTFRALFGKKLKRPVLTKKTIVLIFAGLITLILFPLVLFLIIKNIFWFAFGLLVFDIFTPKITSIIVLLFQPLTVFFWRNRIIKKAKEKREKLKNLLVIGITGSYGKSSTKEFLAEILSKKFKVLKTKKHINAEIGIAKTVLNELKKEHEILIAEIGAYNKGKIKEVCKVLKPKIGILTGINEQHMATFGSQENIVKAKYELIESLPSDGLAIFNGENKYCTELYQKTKEKKKLYCLSDAKNIQIEKQFISFNLSKDGDSANFEVNLLGAHNVLNILGAVAVAKELGMSLEKISKACQKIKPTQGGITLKKGTNSLDIIDATYSANPDGVISHLEHLKLWKTKKMIIMPCLIELGKASKEVHKRIGEKIGEVCDLAIITTKDRFKEIKESAIEKGMKKENILFIENPYKIFEKVKSFSKLDDIVLLESRVPNKVIDLLKLK